MEKTLFTICLLATLILSFNSCIKDESLNSEADILSFELPDSIIYAKPSVSNDEIILFVKADADLAHTQPIITLTPGAKIAPMAEEYDLTQTKKFVVSSEDGKYEKEYTVKMISRMNYFFDFEEWIVPNKFSYPQLKDTRWQSANMAINVTGPGKGPFPTKDTTDCVHGSKALLLETLKGKTYLGRFFPIFPGSLFYGYFYLNINDVAESVLFGQPHPQSFGNPIKFSGYYKYKYGPVYTNELGEVIEGAIDECTIRAFLYRVKKGALMPDKVNKRGEEFLTGSADLFTAEQVVAMADLKDGTAKAEFTHFDISFEYKETPDYEKYDYRLAFLFASSYKGDFNQGAVGSQLILDAVTVVCEKTE